MLMPMMFPIPALIIVTVRLDVIHGRRLNYLDGLADNLHRFTINRNLLIIDYRTAALDRSISRTIGRHPVSHKRTCRSADRGGNRPAIAAAHLVAQDSSGNTADDGAAVSVLCRLHRDLFIPALLPWLFHGAVFGGLTCQRQYENSQHG